MSEVATGSPLRSATKSSQWSAYLARDLGEEGAVQVRRRVVGGAARGARAIDSAMSFGLIRGGHLDVTVLGGLQVDEEGHLGNWLVPSVMVPGMGGAMDLVTGAKRVIVAMTHAAKGTSKVVRRCTLPLTSVRCVDLIVTELAVIEPTDAGPVLLETAPGVTADQVLRATAAQLHIPDTVGTMHC